MDDISKTLERLAITFATRDIMVSEEQLIWAESTSQAEQKLIENPSFSVIPIKQHREFTEYLMRGNIFPDPIQLEDLISDSTPILELATIFSQKEFCFVLSGKRISGYVHFSDLNNQLVKIPYFVLLEAVESRIVSKIDQRITQEDLNIVLLPNQAGRVKNRMKRLAEENADHGYINFMYFGEMLKLACHYKVLTLSDSDLDRITDIRNRVDHADRPLIRTQENAIHLVETREICLDILNQLAQN